MYFKVLQYLCTFTQNSLILFRDSRKKYKKKIRKKQRQQQKPENKTIKPNKNSKIKPKQTGKKQTCMHQTKVYTFTGISNPSKHEVIASMYI